MPKIKEEETHDGVIRLDPPRFALEPTKDTMKGTFMFCDGETLTTYVSKTNRYMVAKVPKNPAEMETEAWGGLGSLGPEILARKDTFKMLVKNVNDSKYLGIDKIDGVACHHLKFFQNNLVWEVWIERGDRPLPHKAMYDLSQNLGKPFGKLRTKMTYRFVNWNLAPQFTDSDFTFTPPADAEKVDSFLELVTHAPVETE